VRCTLRLCMKPPAQKSGSCPTPKSGVFSTCIADCSSDSDCSGIDKCCSNGCGRVCQPPQSVNSGCPGGSAPVNCFMAPCSVSKCDVAGAICSNNYCGGCKAVWTLNGQPVCTAPTSPSTKAGLCPTVASGVMGVCSESCSKDSDCSGANKCCSNGCGHSCRAPAGAVTCSNVRCGSGTACVDTPTGPKCQARVVTQAVADQSSSFGSSSGTSGGLEWVLVGIAALVAVALLAIVIVMAVKFNRN